MNDMVLSVIPFAGIILIRFKGYNLSPCGHPQSERRLWDGKNLSTTFVVCSGKMLLSGPR